MALEKIKKWLYANRKIQPEYNEKYYTDTEKIYTPKNDENHFESWEFVWGIVSPDELLTDTANMYTLNDLDICYNKDTGKYHLSVETAYRFPDGYHGQAKYYDELLDRFAKYMKENGYDTSLPKPDRTIVPVCQLNANSISELYVMFKIFVEGFKVVSNYLGE